MVNIKEKKNRVEYKFGKVIKMEETGLLSQSMAKGAGISIS